MLVGVDVVKHAVQKHLALQTIEPGFIRLPDHLPREYSTDWPVKNSESDM